MNFKAFSEQIIQLRNLDSKLRDKLIQDGKIEEGYNREMEILHNKNAELLQEIMDKIGYPTIEKVGKEANEATWVLVQHAIGMPEFMKKCEELLKIAVRKNTANPIHLAYLTDRIAVFSGKPQLYGTQFDWDENGNLSPNKFDSLSRVNKRRKSIGLNTLKEQTEVIRNRMKREKRKPPNNIVERNQEFEKWKKKMGWIK